VRNRYRTTAPVGESKRERAREERGSEGETEQRKEGERVGGWEKVKGRSERRARGGAGDRECERGPATGWIASVTFLPCSRSFLTTSASGYCPCDTASPYPGTCKYSSPVTSPLSCQHQPAALPHTFTHRGICRNLAPCSWCHVHIAFPPLPHTYTRSLAYVPTLLSLPLHIYLLYCPFYLLSRTPS